MFKEILPTEITGNVFKLISKDWMLITAGSPASYNTMTASWGGLGEIWNRKVAYIFVRPQRYTYEFTEREEFFTLSFFDENHRKALSYCGSHSGRDVDKAKETGLTPAACENGTVCFEQACLVLVCKKAYFQDIQPQNMLIPLEEFYPNHDYHRMYIGEIVKCLIKE